jgi:phenylacetate-coenzyme A ligase PaaK-like adenylate-forming protein
MNLQKYFNKTRQEYQEAYDMLAFYLADEGQDSAEYQLQSFAEIWEDAVTDIPYYKKLVSTRKAPRKIKSWDDFKEIPELTRDIVHNNRAELIRYKSKPPLLRMTGGSTGNPMQFGVSREEGRRIRLLKLILWIRAGYKIDSNIFLLWGHTHLLGNGIRKYRNMLVRGVKDILLGYTRVDAHHLGIETCRKYAQKLLSSKANAVIGYTAAIDQFTRSIPEFRERIRELNLTFVMTCSEMAPREDTYSILSDYFGCPIIQEYGGVDLGQIAMKYHDEPFKVFHRENIVESLDAEAEKESSPVLVTTTYKRYFPLIRYRAGDLLQGCKLNTQGNVISFKSLSGRENDVVTLPNGEILHSLSFLHCIREEKEVHQVQLILEDHGMEILLVVSMSYSEEVEKRIRVRLLKLSSSLTNFSIRTTNDLSTTIAGKRSWVIDRRKRNAGA